MDVEVHQFPFSTPGEHLSLRKSIEFYRHRHNWSNRLIAGDSLPVMNILIEKEGLAGQVRMICVDPPYGIRHGSNFQPFVNRRQVTDGKDACQGTNSLLFEAREHERAAVEIVDVRGVESIKILDLPT